MKRLFNLFGLFTVITLLAVTSCNNDPETTSGIKAGDITVDGMGGNVVIAYTITGADASELTVKCDAEWLHDFVVDSSFIRCVADVNSEKQERNAIVTLSCGTLPAVNVTVTQSPSDVDFIIQVSNITPYTAHVTYTPVNHNGAYFFLVIEKEKLDEYLRSDLMDEYYAEDLEWLQSMAEYSGLTLDEYLIHTNTIYSVFPDVVEMDYTTLEANNSYYAYCYGMESDGTRTTDICLKEFSTRIVDTSDITFELNVTDVDVNEATITVTPSNDEYYFWTYISEMDYAKYDDEAVMANMVDNINSTVQYGYATMEELLHNGVSSERPNTLWSGTKYHIIAWGMNLKGAPTTTPKNIGSFTTLSAGVNDDCTFEISCPDVKHTDILINVKPSNPNTRYMICPVENSICGAYGDEQMAQRLINMEQARFDESFYGAGVDWSNAEWIFTGEQTQWGRADLDWTFEAGKTYRIYVFGIDATGTRTTAVARFDQKTPDGKKSDMTFEVELIKNAWDHPIIRVTPSNDEEYWLSCMLSTEVVGYYRNADGSINDEEMMHMLNHEYFDGDAKYYAMQGTKENTYYWASDSEYTLVICGWSGSNTTPFYEFSFKTPAIPWGESQAAVDVKYELFDGAELAKMDMFKWAGYEDNCIIYIQYTPNEHAAHWYGGVWMSVDSYMDTGGVDHLVSLLRNPDVSHCDREYGMYRGLWFGDDIFSLSWFAEDADGKLGEWNYVEFKPTREGEGYNMTEPYDFWSSMETNSAILTFKK